MAGRILFSFFLCEVIVFAVRGGSQTARCETNSDETLNLLQKFPPLSFRQQNPFEVECTKRGECISEDTCEWSTSCHEVAVKKAWPVPFYRAHNRIPAATNLSTISRGTTTTKRGSRTRNRRPRRPAFQRLRTFRQRSKNRQRQNSESTNTLYSVFGIKKDINKNRFEFYCCLVTSRVVDECGWLKTPMPMRNRRSQMSVSFLKGRTFGRKARARDAAIRDIVIQKSSRGTWEYQIETCLTRSLPTKCVKDEDPEKKETSDQNTNNNENKQRNNNNDPQSQGQQPQGQQSGLEGIGEPGNQAGGSNGRGTRVEGDLGLGIGFPL